VAGRSCDAVSPQPASEERLHSERKGAVTQIDTPAEGTLRESFEATGGPTLRRAGPPPPVAASPRVDPANGENLRPPEPQPGVCQALQFVIEQRRRGDGKIRGEERADARAGSRGWPPLRPLRPRVRRASRHPVSQPEEAINPLRVRRPVGPARGERPGTRARNRVAARTKRERMSDDAKFILGIG
jgi:hypothetical protein